MTNILTEKSNKNSANIDLMSSLDILKVINDEDMKVAQAVNEALPDIANAVDLIENAFMNNGRLAFFGAGTSGRL